MRSIIISILAFFLAFSPVGAESATPDDCDGGRRDTCEIVAFEGTNDDGEPVFLVTTRLNADLTRREALSDEFIIEYIEGSFSNEDTFVILGDGTDSFEDYVGPRYLPDADFRVVIGETDIHGATQDSVLFVAYQDGYVYIFYLFGTHTSFIEYVEDVVGGDDMTTIPEGMVEYEGENEIDGDEKFV